MWVHINTSWHFVSWTDPDYVSMHGEMLHKTRCGLLRIGVGHANFPWSERTCERCLRLNAKDDEKASQA